LYTLGYVNLENAYYRVGPVKIAKAGWEYSNDEEHRTPLDASFESLSSGYVSVGQDASYYQRLQLAFPSGTDAVEVLAALQDLSLDPDRIGEFDDQRVLSQSLFRSVSRLTVQGEFHRIVIGEGQHAPYSFAFVQPSRTGIEAPIRVEFDVDPQSKPPSNVHALIGRNGSGKSRLLHSMVRRLVDWPAPEGTPLGDFSADNDIAAFGNVVFVSFSAFDQPEIPLGENRNLALPYVYVGLRKERSASEGGGIATLTPEGLVEYFLDSARSIVRLDRVSFWLEAVTALESDQNFEDSRIRELVQDFESDGATDELIERAREFFSSRLSSGHKIVLLTITRLVETIVDRSLVLLDEPEAHLHPPLLAAFVRALSDLLKRGNGVAVAATHSPVILQEVPQGCAWIIVRNGEDAQAIRPIRETFGEGVGLLTHDVFELEVVESGFYQMVRREAERQPSEARVLEEFGQRLGSEARLLLHSWYAARTRND